MIKLTQAWFGHHSFWKGNIYSYSYIERLFFFFERNDCTSNVLFTELFIYFSFLNNFYLFKEKPYTKEERSKLQSMTNSEKCRTSSANLAGWSVFCASKYWGKKKKLFFAGVILFLDVKTFFGFATYLMDSFTVFLWYSWAYAKEKWISLQGHESTYWKCMEVY